MVTRAGWEESVLHSGRPNGASYERTTKEEWYESRNGTRTAPQVVMSTENRTERVEWAVGGVGAASVCRGLG